MTDPDEEANTIVEETVEEQNREEEAEERSESEKKNAEEATTPAPAESGELFSNS